MGCTREDLMNLFAGAGIKKDPKVFESISHIFTAWSVYFSTLAALDFLHEDLKGRIYVLQGFGNVGSEYCKFMYKKGARLLAVSTRAGAIYNKKGIDVGEILELRKKYGDKFVLEYKKGERIDGEKLIELDVDIAVPCARCWAIDSNNVERIKAKIIPCAANVAMDLDIEKKLILQNKIVIPDFVANCGGCFGTSIMYCLTNKSIYKILKKTYKKRVSNLINKSGKTGETISELAVREMTKKTGTYGTKKSEPVSHLNLRGIFKKIIPYLKKQPVLCWYYSRKFFQ
ncbi:hypothetical protein HY745_15170 [Candidatus Desantisbacteria bacterium]|nr:hypothetical protein [Candidatus Desantisbacteria bacterium]